MPLVRENPASKSVPENERGFEVREQIFDFPELVVFGTQVLAVRQLMQLVGNRAAQLDVPSARELTTDKELDAALRPWRRSCKSVLDLPPRKAAALRLPTLRG